jgi:hypothetical protein
MLVRQFSLEPLRPAFSPEMAVTRPVRLPYGGPTGVGGRFAKGTVLAPAGATAQSEVATLTVGTATGDLTTYFTADKVYVVTHAINATVAAVQTAWQTVFGEGNVAVTGVAGTNYILTFQQQLANSRIGGLFGLSANGTAAWARTTRGSSGIGQFDAYLDGTIDPARAILVYDYMSDPAGGNVTEIGSTCQATSPVAYFAGFFNAADLTGLDANAVSDPGFRLVLGTAFNQTGAVIALGL